MGQAIFHPQFDRIVFKDDGKHLCLYTLIIANEADEANEANEAVASRKKRKYIQTTKRKQFEFLKIVICV